MKKAFIFVLLLTGLITFTPASGFAQTLQLEKPDVPSDYEQWPYKKLTTCGEPGKTISTAVFGTFNLLESDPPQKEFLFVGKLAVNGENQWLIYLVGQKTEAEYAYMYQRDDNGWTKVNVITNPAVLMTHEKILGKRIQKVLNVSANEVGKLFEAAIA